jgi:hypothetical protein
LPTAAGGHEEILSAVRDLIGRDPDVDHPQRNQNLEQYFLEISIARAEKRRRAPGLARRAGCGLSSVAEHPS